MDEPTTALEHTRTQYLHAKHGLTHQHQQLAELQDHLITQQADKLAAQLQLLRARDATIAVLQDELARVRGVLAGIADAVRPAGGGQTTAAAGVRVDKALPAMPPHDRGPGPRTQATELPPPHPTPTLTRGIYGANTPHAYTAPRSLSTLSLSLSLPSPSPTTTTTAHQDPAAAKPRHQRYASPLAIVAETPPPAPPTPALLAARRGDLPSVEEWRRSSVMVGDSAEEDEMRRRIRAEAERRKRAAFGEGDRVLRESAVLTSISTQEPRERLHRIGSISMGMSAGVSDSKKKAGVQKSSITHTNLSLPQDVHVGSGAGEYTAGGVGSQVAGIERGLSVPGAAGGGGRRGREGRGRGVMDRIRGWKEKEKGNS